VGSFTGRAVVCKAREHKKASHCRLEQVGSKAPVGRERVARR
jgi:hypothetical protein